MSAERHMMAPVTPKMQPDRPLSMLRYQKMGETVISLAGSPVIAQGLVFFCLLLAVCLWTHIVYAFVLCVLLFQSDARGCQYQYTGGERHHFGAAVGDVFGGAHVHGATGPGDAETVAHAAEQPEHDDEPSERLICADAGGEFTILFRFT